MRSTAEMDRALELYSDTVRRVCFLHLKNNHDVEDIFQEVFIKYMLYDKKFESDAHEKAWLIRVAINASKDILKSFFRKNVSSINDSHFNLSYTDINLENDEKNLLNVILKLPPNYKNIIYLFYYEGYTAVEIAKMLKKKENTIYTWLNRARKELKKQLGDDFP